MQRLALTVKTRSEDICLESLSVSLPITRRRNRTAAEQRPVRSEHEPRQAEPETAAARSRVPASRFDRCQRVHNSSANFPLHGRIVLRHPNVAGIRAPHRLICLERSKRRKRERDTSSGFRDSGRWAPADARELRRPSTARGFLAPVRLIRPIGRNRHGPYRDRTGDLLRAKSRRQGSVSACFGKDRG
jgi:hypothetical protein